MRQKTVTSMNGESLKKNSNLERTSWGKRYTISKVNCSRPCSRNRLLERPWDWVSPRRYNFFGPQQIVEELNRIFTTSRNVLSIILK